MQRQSRDLQSLRGMPQVEQVEEPPQSLLGSMRLHSVTVIALQGARFAYPHNGSAALPTSSGVQHSTSTLNGKVKTLTGDSRTGYPDTHPPLRDDAVTPSNGRPPRSAGAHTAVSDKPTVAMSIQNQRRSRTLCHQPRKLPLATSGHSPDLHKRRANATEATEPTVISFQVDGVAPH